MKQPQTKKLQELRPQRQTPQTSQLQTKGRQQLQGDLHSGGGQQPQGEPHLEGAQPQDEPRFQNERPKDDRPEGAQPQGGLYPEGAQPRGQLPQDEQPQSEFANGYITQEDRFLAVNAATRFTKAYEASCKQFCRETGLTQTALDVLIFLANNPELNNACDVVAKLGFKSTHVSASVDRLVDLGLVRRDPVAGDRRRFSLVVTAEAKSVVEGGRAIRRAFQRRATAGVSDEDAAAFMRIVAQVSQNIDAMEAAAKKRTARGGAPAEAKGEYPAAESALAESTSTESMSVETSRKPKTRGISQEPSKTSRKPRASHPETTQRPSSIKNPEGECEQ